MFHRRKYLEFLQRHVFSFETSATAVDHNGFGFPLRMRPGVYYADPCISHSAECILQVLPENLNECDCLDVGTGSGVIAIEASLRGAHVVAIDADPLAVSLAIENVSLNGLQDTIVTAESDLFESRYFEGRQFDYITANLWFPISTPGFNQDRMAALAVLDRFLTQAFRYLKPGGRILLSSADFADRRSVRAIFRKLGLEPGISTLKAQYGKGVWMNWHCYQFTQT